MNSKNWNNKEPAEEESQRKRYQLIASYISLPFVLAIPPIVGWYIGTWLDHAFATKPYLAYVLLVLGIISGVREFYRIVVKHMNEEP